MGTDPPQDSDPEAAKKPHQRRQKSDQATSKSWFVVDQVGFAQTLARRPKDFIICELVQNTWDEPGVTKVLITQIYDPATRLTTIRVVDDKPGGVNKLSDLYTMYAPSNKKSEAEQRGRFNVGEKSVISGCKRATVTSTTGSLIFDENGRRTTGTRTKRGTIVELELRLTEEERALCKTTVFKLIPPPGKVTFFNGVELLPRIPCAEFTVTLATEIADPEGNLRRTSRKTIVRLHEPRPGEIAAIYEMGILVVETGDLYHVDVQQKVPLGVERDNVSPAYLRHLRTYILNEMHGQVSGEDAKAEWVNVALADRNVSSDAVRTVVTERFGKRAVTYDPSDPEANKLAAAEGRPVVTGGSFSAPQWGNIREAGALLPAGRVTPSPRAFDEDGMPITLIPSTEWTKAETVMVSRYHRIAKTLVGIDIRIVITDELGCRFLAAYGPRAGLYLYRAYLDNSFFESGLSERALSLLIHELGHHYCSDHLSSLYYDALTSLGAPRLFNALSPPSLSPICNRRGGK